MSEFARSLLVTGGAGFIGSNFVHYWRRVHPADRVIVLDALTYAGSLRNLGPLVDDAYFRFVHGDITNPSLVNALLRDERIDTIVNFAAESHVDRSISDPETFVRTNVVGVQVLLAAARRAWQTEGRVPNHRFHQVSTDEVYGSIEPSGAASVESDPFAPNSPYAASKAAADHLVRAYFRTYDLAVTTSNSSNNYGPRQFPEKLIPLAISKVLAGKSIPVYGDGRNQRDWLHVNEHCHGIDLVLQHGRVGESYNLSDGESCENLNLLERLCRIIDSEFAVMPGLARRFPLSPPARGGRSDSLIGFVADRLGHDRRYAMDSNKARRELGFAPSQSLDAGLAGTVGWYLANETWWDGQR